MRDENKKQAISEAAIEIVNELGFAHASMSKIAKRAGVSPATIYIYFESKDHLILELYRDIKKQIADEMLNSIDDNADGPELFRALWRNMFHYIIAKEKYFVFSEQCSNSPMLSQAHREELKLYFKPVFDIYRDLVDRGLARHIDTDLLITYTFMPIMTLAKEHLAGNIIVDDDKLEKAIDLSIHIIKK